MSSKQDRQGVRKASDVERKYNLGLIASTVRVIQQKGSPGSGLGNYYTKSEVDSLISSIEPSGDYRIVDGVTEWINPPMELDTEYRTTERLLGKPVYTKLVSQDISYRGADDMESGVPYSIEIPVSTPNFDRCIRFTGHTVGWLNIVIPEVKSYSYMVISAVTGSRIYVDVNNNSFADKTQLYIQFWYTKTE